MSHNIHKLYQQRNKLRAKWSKAMNSKDYELADKYVEELEKLGRQIDRLKKEH